MLTKVFATMWMIGVVCIAKELRDTIKSDLEAETDKSTNQGAE